MLINGYIRLCYRQWSKKERVVYAVNKAILYLKSRVDSIYMTVDMDVLDISVHRARQPQHLVVLW